MPPRHAHTRLAVALLLVVLVLQGSELWTWHLANDLPGRRICCDYAGEAARAVRIQAQRGMPWGERWQPRYGLLPWSALPLFHRVGPEGFALTIGLFSLLLTALCFDITRRLAGPWAGLLAAALAPVTPLLAYASRRWDTMLPLATLTALGVWALLLSRSLTRVTPTLLLAGTVALLAAFTSRETDNLLALATVGAATAASLLRGVTVQRDAFGERAPRWRAALGAAGLAAAAVAAAPLLHFTSPEGAAYYLNESAGPASPAQAASTSGPLAYLGHLFWRGLTPPLGVALEAGVLLWLLRGRGRAELAGWALVPFVALSAVPKRNFYYPSPVWSALPVLLALGVAAIPGRRLGAVVRIGLGLALVGYGAVQLADRRSPEADPVADQERQRAWLRGNSTWGGAFQTSDDNLSLAARAAPWLPETAATLTAALTLDACDCRSTVLSLGPREVAQLGLWVLPEQPCLEVWTSPRLPRDARLVGFAGDKRELRRLSPDAQAQILAMPDAGTVAVDGWALSVRVDNDAQCVR